MPVVSQFERMGVALWWSLHHPFASGSRAALKVTRISGDYYEAERVIRRTRDTTEPIVLIGKGRTPAEAIEVVNLKLDKLYMSDTGEDTCDFPGRNRSWVPGDGSEPGRGRADHSADRR
jgi:hypothetical protein